MQFSLACASRIRDLVRLMILGGCLLALPMTTAGEERVDADALMDQVAERARSMAAEPHRQASNTLPGVLRDLNYDQYRSIRFNSESAVWRDESLFEVQLFHPGFLYTRPVRIHVVEDGQIEELAFSPELFRYEGPAAHLEGRIPEDTGFAGFRVHYPLNRADYADEFLVFLGASYFRVVGRDQGYGLSGRGLAIDTASSNGEEFPEFREFWLIQPEADASRLTVIALMDSPSLTGAYRFEVIPGRDVVMEVDARLFARSDVRKLGVAPLTSMFAYGETTVRLPDDFRPRVHDSDGLLARTARDEWIWRPLSNPRRLRITSLQDSEPRGFGLFQRNRDFDAYLDMEARYERRPSKWVEPLDGDWGSGGVELVEIPTPSEVNDNIVAYWVPDATFRAGQERHFRYRVSTLTDRHNDQRVARVVRMRQGWGAVPGQENPPPRSVRHFSVDFSGGELEGLDISQPVEAELTSSTGEVRNLMVQRLPDGNTWRASFRLQPDGERPADFRLHLSLRDRRLTETWSYVWYPDELR